MRRTDRVVRVGVDPRRHADERAASPERDGPLDVVERVDDERGARACRGRQVVVALVVPVEDDVLACDAGGARICELARGRDVGAEALRSEEPQQRDVRERLRAVENERSRRRLEVLARAPPQRLLAEHEQGRAVLGGEVGRRDAAEPQLGVVDGRRFGEEVECAHDSRAGRWYICSSDRAARIA